MPNATADGITLINFGMGSPNAATVMDLLSAIHPKAALFLGKCGGLKKKNAIGDLVLLTKADKLTRSEGAKVLSIVRLQAGGGEVKLFSALKKQGVGEAADALSVKPGYCASRL